jgi:hypothetical protein
MGSAHPPNVEAARFLVERVAPALPGLEIHLLGAVCDRLPGTLPGNVRRLGFVADEEKRRELAGCAAALNPLFSGAGTNLKMLDYMAAGAPIVTTAVGARGLALTHGVDAYLAEGDAWVETLRAVVAAPDAARTVGQTAQRTAFARYTWSEIASGVHVAIERAIAPDAAAPDAGRPALVVVNDFPVAVATNGGQVRIRELLIELARDFDVTLLCFTRDSRRYERTIVRGVVEIGIPKSAEHRAAEISGLGQTKVSIDDLVAAEHCLGNADFVATFRRHAERSGAVVFEHPYLAPLLDVTPEGIPVVYSSLNVEAELKEATLRSRPDAAERLAAVAALETRLLRRADLVVCVSADDRERFRRSASIPLWATVHSVTVRSLSFHPIHAVRAPSFAPLLAVKAPTFSKTATGDCIAGVFRSLTIAPFNLERMTMSQMVTVH